MKVFIVTGNSLLSNIRKRITFLLHPTRSELSVQDLQQKGGDQSETKLSCHIGRTGTYPIETVAMIDQIILRSKE